MNYNSRTVPERPQVVIDYGAFQQPPSRLVRDYLQCTADVRPFYGPSCWDLDGLLGAAGEVQRLPRAREVVTAALLRQQRARGAETAAMRAEALLDHRAVAIVTGQQPVLFGGPLFVLYKALAAVRVARELEERRHAPVVPIFWVASDDHDFAEIRSVSVLDEAGHPRDLRYVPHREPQGQPASQIVLDETIGEVVE